MGILWDCLTFGFELPFQLAICQKTYLSTRTTLYVSIPLKITQRFQYRQSIMDTVPHDGVRITNPILGRAELLDGKRDNNGPVIDWDNRASMILKTLPEIRFSSKAKIYRYHQIDGTMVPGDYDTSSWFWSLLWWDYSNSGKITVTIIGGC